ncbi:MAG: S-layer homology domain-containing protein, partial [Phormidesmis sp.]
MKKSLWLNVLLGLSISLGLGLSTPSLSPASVQTTRFTDVPTDYWAHDYIEGLADLNIVSGFPDGTFHPTDNVSRAQFAAILRQAFLQSQPASALTFKDVQANSWAADAISAARSGGFLTGYPDNTFKPYVSISRVDALLSLVNGLKYAGTDDTS